MQHLLSEKDKELDHVKQLVSFTRWKEGRTHSIWSQLARAFTELEKLEQNSREKDVQLDMLSAELELELQKGGHDETGQPKTDTAARLPEGEWPGVPPFW